MTFSDTFHLEAYTIPQNRALGHQPGDEGDTHTAAWNWGDGTTSTGIVNEDGTVTGNHKYVTAGIYTLMLTVVDGSGDSDSSIFEYVVIYDPEGGFVTGGGWIDSPPGAYTPDNDNDPDLTGKANFGFVSKYRKGATEPTGNTQFVFHVADLNFHSDSYQWLVVAGSKAKFKGDGTINGEGNYGFMLSAIDAALTPNTDVDLFRIKIWDKDDGDTVVYDNQVGVDDDADPITEIGGGSIVIHDAMAAPESIPGSTLILSLYPVPANPDVWIPYQLGSDSKVVIRIHDASGRPMRTLDLGYQPAGYYVSKDRAAHWDGDNEAGELVASGIYFCTIEAGSYIATKKFVIMR